MKHWEKRIGTIDDGGNHLVECEVSIIQHNWRGWFLTIRTSNPEDVLNFHHMKALGQQLGEEFGLEKAITYNYYAESQLWERGYISNSKPFEFAYTGARPGFIVEREIHFGDSAHSREDFLKQVEAAQQQFNRDSERTAKTGRIREVNADEGDSITVFEDPSPYQKAIEAFNEEMARILRVEDLEIKVAEEHFRISAETHRVVQTL